MTVNTELTQVRRHLKDVDVNVPWSAMDVAINKDGKSLPLRRRLRPKPGRHT